MLSLLEQVDILSPRCQYDSCKRTANNGSAQDGVRHLCSQHKHAGMVRQPRAKLTHLQDAGACASDVLQQ